MSKQINKGLGKGFGSLLPQDFDQSILLDKHDRVQKISLNDIKADPTQPRRTFDETLIVELAQSIKQYGILQPLVVTEQDGEYRIVAGERRFRAAKVAGLKNVPVLVRSVEELERLEISLVENVQRVDLNPIEQAVSIARLHEQFNVNYQEIAKRLGKAHTTIVNIVRLLQLPDFARNALTEGRITEGHARAILALKNAKLQKELLKNIEQENWSVRRAEQFVSENRTDNKRKDAEKIVIPSSINKTTSKKLSTKLGFKVTVSESPSGGKISMSFSNPEQLKEFIDFLDKTKN
jgi:ParB family transcriptional regulator, chromosome partitioning protein